ncbi:cytochrome P450 [Microdochium trichocladiopsis]|uniref:Cytochrome P450 n=1 Tax=Microdochium trichocladiopsis TaxID=1682393 RepID=A0A9P9BHM3_9PEZI|nr:cytochrome P450 [Microdochium trichocladiopsis]KAH7020695.1 cytochrome P450 [Microdochium trichocladiopsis]
MEPSATAYASLQSSLHSALESLPIDKTSLLPYGLLLLPAFAVLYSASKPASKFPEVNPKNAFELTDGRRVKEFMANSMELLKTWEKRVGGSPYRLFCENGLTTMLPFNEVENMRSDKRFDFSQVASDDTHGYLPGFEAFGNDPTIIKVVNKHLTKALTKITAPLSHEAELVIQQTLGDSTEWELHNAPLAIMKIVSRMSARVFMGEELCRDDKWNVAAADYTRKLFSSTTLLSEKPRWMRPWIHWFMPEIQEVRTAQAAAIEAFQPHLDRREKEKAAALARGEDYRVDDSIEWFAKEGSTHPPAIDQTRLTVVAIHTTSDLLTEAMLNIAMHPELFQPLREEVVSVLSTHGLKKTGLYELQLMDAVLKESQRLKPVLLSWKRILIEDVTLPSGTALKKGEKVAVSLLHMWDDEQWKDAATFDPYRFIRMRESSNEANASHLVSTSPSHMGFGHGVHACPGRFFASNELKIALCHLILKYDWKLPGAKRPDPVVIGMQYMANPESNLLFRRRKEELDFSALER